MKANPLKSALASAAFTFVGLFGASLLGFIGQVVTWANNGGKAAFPAMGGLALAAVAAAGAAATGLVTFVVRWAQTNGWLPGDAPQFPTPPVPDAAGSSRTDIMFAVMCVAACVLVVLGALGAL